VSEAEWADGNKTVVDDTPRTGGVGICTALSSKISRPKIRQLPPSGAAGERRAAFTAARGKNTRFGPPFLSMGVAGHRRGHDPGFASKRCPERLRRRRRGRELSDSRRWLGIGGLDLRQSPGPRSPKPRGPPCPGPDVVIFDTRTVWYRSSPPDHRRGLKRPSSPLHSFAALPLHAPPRSTPPSPVSSPHISIHPMFKVRTIECTGTGQRSHVVTA
jgi:hypothetical protein